MSIRTNVLQIKGPQGQHHWQSTKGQNSHRKIVMLFRRVVFKVTNHMVNKMYPGKTMELLFVLAVCLLAELWTKVI